MLTRVSLAAALTAVAALSVGSANSADEKTPTIKEIMRAGHKGDQALTAKIGQAAKAAKWGDAQALAKKLSENGAALAKNTPKKGDAKSWESLAAKYAENTKAVYEATEKKDAKATKAALDTIAPATCKECHSAHRGK
jgi:hypothetical protein